MKDPNICSFHVLSILVVFIIVTLFSVSSGKLCTSKHMVLSWGFQGRCFGFLHIIIGAALDFWVVKNVSERILVGLRWWNEINNEGESVWQFECLDHESLARMNRTDSWLFWWTLYLAAILWFALGIFSLIRFQEDYLHVVGVCLTLGVANIIGFTKCRKDAKKQLQAFASQTIASRFSSTLQSAFTVV